MSPRPSVRAAEPAHTSDSQTLIPPHVRIWAWRLVALAVMVVVALGLRYAGQSAPGRLDTALDTRLAVRLASHRRFLDRLVLLGDPSTVIATALVLANMLAVQRRWRAAVLAVVAPGLGGALTELVLKPLVGRTKGGGLAFPSGHTTGAFCLAFVAALLLIQPGEPPFPVWLRSAVGLGGLALAAGTATALVALRAHYATDTVGGIGVAIVAVVGAALTLDAIGRPRSPT